MKVDIETLLEEVIGEIPDKYYGIGGGVELKQQLREKYLNQEK